MATVKFKPICECGYIFRLFEYRPERTEYAEREHALYGLLKEDYFEPEYCPNCGKRITNFTIPVFYQGGRISFKDDDEPIELVPVIRCKDCVSYITYADMQKNNVYKDFDNPRGYSGFCMNTDKWVDENEFCANGEKGE